MIMMVTAGRWASIKWGREEGEPKGGLNSLLGVLFGLSGFILAFTFGMSGTRLEKVRNVVEQEANDIGTAILRSDLYADSVREEFRADFKNYLEAVIDFYENTSNINRLYKAKEDAARAAAGLWALATRQSKLPNMLIPSNQMVPALNAMFDTAQTREIILKSKVPDLIVYMLFVCVLSTCFVGGFTSTSFFQRKDWVIITGFALVSSMVIYTTLDLARPMRGVIKEKAGQEAIIELREMFLTK
jgi:hypothetical protein